MKKLPIKHITRSEARLVPALQAALWEVKLDASGVANIPDIKCIHMLNDRNLDMVDADTANYYEDYGTCNLVITHSERLMYVVTQRVSTASEVLMQVSRCQAWHEQSAANAQAVLQSREQPYKQVNMSLKSCSKPEAIPADLINVQYNTNNGDIEAMVATDSSVFYRPNTMSPQWYKHIDTGIVVCVDEHEPMFYVFSSGLIKCAKVITDTVDFLMDLKAEDEIPTVLEGALDTTLHFNNDICNLDTQVVDAMQVVPHVVEAEGIKATVYRDKNDYICFVSIPDIYYEETRVYLDPSKFISTIRRWDPVLANTVQTSIKQDTQAEIKKRIVVNGGK